MGQSWAANANRAPHLGLAKTKTRCPRSPLWHGLWFNLHLHLQLQSFQRALLAVTEKKNMQLTNICGLKSLLTQTSNLQCGEHYADCCSDPVTFVRGSIMMWNWQKQALSPLKAVIHWKVMVVAIPYLHKREWSTLPWQSRSRNRNAISQPCVTRLVTSMRRRCQVVVAMHCSFTHNRGFHFVQEIKDWITNTSC